MKKALVVCRTGMGSSMMLNIKLSKIISSNDFPIELEHDVLDGLGGHAPDLIIAMNDLADEVSDAAPYVIGVRDIMDTAHMERELRRYLVSCGEIGE